MLLLTLTGCSPEMPDMTTPPPPVSILEVTPSRVALTDDLTGRVAPVRVAEIRPQVTGIIQERLFVQGAEVHAGQPLFQINPAPFKAEVETSAAALMRAEAALSRAQIQVKRLQPLVEGDAVSRQTYDDAVSSKDQAAAEVAQAKAELSRRKLIYNFQQWIRRSTVASSNQLFLRELWSVRVTTLHWQRYNKSTRFTSMYASLLNHWIC
ncbi:efflux RND transporter periplasmic adaptor subunit [Providencia rettgeri]|uniref:Efflux RND transporter periplasmic adaptor subunit n=1 Tax=Providencia rettgeri TaxID=587 RepID=A0A939NDT3_PRORE|nr:efflux RND transporter periplasmic adaptor subunit [Providencia rettgeri]MBO1916716.1 efflux RND transporter periplasmic adaptor subunit [Providencia rettgeri]